MMPASTVLPFAGESLTGFIRRLARSEGYPFLRDFKVWLGVDYGRTLVEDLKVISDEFGIEVEALHSIAPQSPSVDPMRDWRFHRTHRDPFCSVCLSEGQPWAQSWRHSFVTACEHHETSLIDACPRCCAAVTTRTGGLELCDCGASFADIEPQAASRDELRLSALYRTGCGPMVPDAAHADVLDGELNRLVQFLASNSWRKRTGRAGKDAMPVDVASSREFLQPVYGLLFDWPTAFDAEVERRWRAAPEGKTAAQRLGNWYRSLNGFSGHHGRALAGSMNELVARKFADPYARTSGQERTWVSAAEAAREIGVSATRLVAAVAAGKIEGVIGRSGTGHRHTMIKRDTILQIRQDRADYMTGLEARGLLGVSKKQWALMREAGVVGEVPSDERPALVDGGFARSQLSAVLAEIAGDAIADCEAELIKFSDITLRKTGNRTALLMTYQKIFQRAIRPVTVADGVRFGDFEFRLSDVRRAFSGLGTVTAQEVSKLTGWKFECVTHWCRCGLLPARKIRSGRGDSWAIELADLSRFQSQYIVLSQAAREMGTSSRALISECAKVGLETFGSKPVGETSRGHLIRVADLLRLSRTLIRPARSASTSIKGA